MAQNNIYLDNILGKNYNSGKVQIDIPVPKKYETRKRIKPDKQRVAGSTLAGTAIGSFGGPAGAVVGGVAGLVAGIGQSLADIASGIEYDIYSVPTRFGYKSIEAFCTDDITISLGNEWGSILPQLKSIMQFSQLGNEGNVVNWLSGTKASWLGNKPLTFPLTFYVFSFSPERNALNIIEPLIELAGVSEGGGRFDLSFFGLEDAGVRVHNGYRVAPFENNTEYIQRSLTPKNDNATITVHLGDQLVIDNLLLGDIQITHSNIQVARGVPLYVKVQANFRTVGVPTVYDIQRWYVTNRVK